MEEIKIYTISDRLHIEKYFDVFDPDKLEEVEAMEKPRLDIILRNGGAYVAYEIHEKGDNNGVEQEDDPRGVMEFLLEVLADNVDGWSRR